MSAQPHNDDTASDTVAAGARGRTEPLASILEYVQRVNDAGRIMEYHINQLGDEFLVFTGGYGRVQESRPGGDGWQPGAVVIGPPGVFIVWPAWCDVDAMLMKNAELCRRHIFEALGGQFLGAVEIVIFAPSGQEKLARCLVPAGLGLPAFDVLVAQGNLARLLQNYEPDGGLERLSPSWLAELRQMAMPRRELDGPDARARQMS